MGEIKELYETLKKADETPFYSAVVIVSPDREKFLIGKRKEDGIYTSPAGGAKMGESPKETAIRETFEESGIRLTPGMLKELPICYAKKNKVVHCFMAVLKEDIYPHVRHDPDKEVWQWRWVPIESSLPEPMDENRKNTFVEAKMKLMGIKKAETYDLYETLQKGRSVPIGSVSPNGKLVKVGQGNWEPISNKHHKVNVKFKIGDKSYNKTMVVEGQTHDHAWDQAQERIKNLEQKTGQKVDIQGRSVSKLSKSLASSEISGIDINTTEEAVHRQYNKNDCWMSRLEDFLQKVSNWDEPPTELPLDFPYVLVVNSPVDHGIYDGYVKQVDPNSGEYGKVMFQIRKMTPAAMLEALKAKGFVTEIQMDKEEEDPEKEIIRELIDALKENNKQDVNIHVHSDSEKEGIPGGLAEEQGKKPEDFDPEALAEGTKVEMEHTDNPNIAQEIAMDNLTKDPDYYSKDEDMEKADKKGPAEIGEKREWQSGTYEKTQQGWVPVSEGKEGKKEEESGDKKSSQEESQTDKLKDLIDRLKDKGMNKDRAMEALQQRGYDSDKAKEHWESGEKPADREPETDNPDVGETPSTNSDEAAPGDEGRPSNQFTEPEFNKPGSEVTQNDVESFIEKWHEDFDEVGQKLEELKQNGAKSTAQRLKAPESLLEKMNNRKSDRSLNTMTDILGSRALSQSLEEQQKTLEYVKNNFETVEIDDSVSQMRPGGYRAIHVLFRTSNGRIGEMQLKTERQQIFSGFTHDTLYKPPGTLSEDTIQEIQNSEEVQKYSEELSDYLYKLDQGEKDDPEKRPTPPKILTQNGIEFPWDKIEELDKVEKAEDNSKKNGKLKYFLVHRNEDRTVDKIEDHESLQDAWDTAKNLRSENPKGEYPIGQASDKDEFVKTFSEYDPNRKIGGPGSRGGKIIGYDKKGNPIYQKGQSS